MANSDNLSEGYYISTLPDVKIDGDISGTVMQGLADITNVSIANSNLEDYFINTSTVNWNVTATPFVNCMPDLHRVHEMCEEYPSLAKAFENFKTVYAMVDQDWKGKNS